MEIFCAKKENWNVFSQEWSPDDDMSGSLRSGVAIYSLYGEVRKPTPEMLEGLDALLVDLQDVGSRYYTFIWTMVLAMEAAFEKGIDVVVVDRPNPLGGDIVEGPLLMPGYESFVGIMPGIVVRHGLTIAEVAQFALKERPQIVAALDKARKEGKYVPKLHILPMEGYERGMLWEDTGLHWVIPSPNMPTPDTARVYPGMCLIEAMTISEARGTTRPFEFCGAPWVADANKLRDELNALGLEGCFWREHCYEPTFHKYARRVCAGIQLHVTDPAKFKPLLAGYALIWALRRQCADPVKSSDMLVPFDPNVPMEDQGKADTFAFKAPPYEYVYDVAPFDILAGSDKWRRMIDDEVHPLEFPKAWAADEAYWLEHRKQYLLY